MAAGQNQDVSRTPSLPQAQGRSLFPRLVQLLKATSFLGEAFTGPRTSMWAASGGTVLPTTQLTVHVNRMVTALTLRTRVHINNIKHDQRI